MNFFKFLMIMAVVLWSAYLIGYFIASHSVNKSSGEHHSVRIVVPSGKRLMAYCDGGMSHILVAQNIKGCIADRPGAFFLTVMCEITLIVLLIILTIICVTRFVRSPKKGG